jgi:hypothetical protein
VHGVAPCVSLAEQAGDEETRYGERDDKRY